MTDEAMKAAAVAVKSAADEDGEVYLTSGFYSLEERADRVARAAIAAFLKAWEPSEEAVKALLTAYCTTAADERGSVRAMLRAEAERMERSNG